MDNENYKFDVAFSFLAEDEPLATQLNDLVQDRLSTFLYSNRQEELAGTDGEKTFNSVFGVQARLVVVLYRVGWGDSSWTRIEQTAIKNRAFEDGYEFVTFIPLDKPASVPKWLPKTQLWVGLDRWGIKGAASVIEARVQELGGLVKEETIEERAVRLERSLKFDEKRKQFLHSHDGVNKSNAQFEILSDEIERLLDMIKNATKSINYSMKRAQYQFIVLGPHAGLNVYWQYQYGNSLDNSKLEATLWKGHPPFPGVMHWDKPIKKGSLKFDFDLLKSGTPGWKSGYPVEREFDSKALAEHILKFYMNDAEPKQ